MIAPLRIRGPAGTGKVDQMATYIAEHYTEGLRVTDIARAARLHLAYAVTLFRKTWPGRVWSTTSRNTASPTPSDCWRRAT